MSSIVVLFIFWNVLYIVCVHYDKYETAEAYCSVMECCYS
jgi:hypothetical protein